MDLFLELCIDGNINELKKYYIAHPDTDIHVDDELAFIMSCKTGHLEVAKWLIELSHTENTYVKIIPINIHADNEGAFKWSCSNGHLDVAKWLIKLSQTEKEYAKMGLINIHATNEYAFRWSCANGHLEIAKWLIEISKNNNIGLINIHANSEDAFSLSVRYDHLEVARWLIELSQTEKEYEKMGLINIHSQDDFPFFLSCAYNHLDASKWLYLLDRRNFNIDVINVRYDYIKNNKPLVRIIGFDYKNNNRIRKEYLKEYHKWKLRCIIRMCGKLMKFYNYIMEKSYSPKGIGYIRACDDFNDKIENSTIKH